MDANEKCVRIKTLSSLKAEYCFRYVSSNMMRIVYGHDLRPDEEDKYVNAAARFGEEMLSSDAPGSHFMDILPLCEHSPQCNIT